MVTRNRMRRHGSSKKEPVRLKRTGDGFKLQKDKYNVLVFGESEHFGNGFSRAFDTREEADEYIDRLTVELERIQGEIESDPDNLSKSFKEKWDVEDDNPSFWIRDTADTIRIIRGENASNVVRDVRMLEDSDGYFQGFSKG